MSAAAITPTVTVPGTPVEGTYVASASDGNTINPPAGPWMLHIKNATTTKVITVVTPITHHGKAVADLVISLGGSKEYFLPGSTFDPREDFVDPTTGLITFTTDAFSASLTFAVIPA